MKLLALFLSVGLGLQAFAGEDRGGGITYKNGLLDLALYNQNAFNDTTPGSLLPLTRAFKVFGFDRLNTENSQVFNKALQQVQKWKTSSPILADKILKALVSMPIYFTAGKMTAAPTGYDLSNHPNIQAKDLETIAVYYRDFGVFISKEAFEALTQKNQIATIIHEGIRHLQISFQSEISDKTLQILTAKIMSEPFSGQTLDTEEMMAGAILDSHLRQQNIMQEISQKTSEACLKYKILCEYSVKNKNSDTILKDLEKGSMQLKALIKKNPNESILADFVYLSTMISLVAVESLSSTLTDIKPEIFKVQKGLHYGLIDWALHDFNKRKSNSDQRKLLKKARLELISEGLIKN